MISPPFPPPPSFSPSYAAAHVNPLRGGELCCRSESGFNRFSDHRHVFFPLRLLPTPHPLPEMLSRERSAAEICLLQGNLTIGVDIFDQIGYNHNLVGQQSNAAEHWSVCNNQQLEKAKTQRREKKESRT